MTERGWNDLIDNIDTMYGVEKTEKLTEKLEDAPNLTKSIDRVEFKKDNQHFRIERIVSPAIVDKKTFYHHRGSANRIQYEYDPEETTSKVVFYRQLPDGYFNEITPEELMS